MISLIICEIKLILTWSANCVTSNVPGEGTLAIANTKIYVPAVTLSTVDNSKVLRQYKLEVKPIINWDEYQSTVTTQVQNQHFDDLVDRSFKGVNRLFVLSFLIIMRIE